MRSPRMRLITASLACAAITLPIAACSGSGSGGSTSGGKTTLNFVYMGTPEQQKEWNKLFAAFEKKNPTIKLKATGLGVDNWGQFFNKVSTQIAGGDVPDVVQVATEGQHMFASKGIVAPIDDYIKKDQKVVDDYYADMDPNLIKWAKDHGSPDGKTYYLPGDFNTVTMTCNTNVLKKAGVTLPAEGTDWTWDDFQNAAKTVKDKTGAYMVTADTGQFAGVMPWVTTAGGSTMNDDWTKATFDTPQVKQAATFVKGLVDKGYAPKPGGTYDAMTAFAQDKLACFGGGRWPVISLRNLDAVEKSQMINWPTKVQNGSPIGWNSYPIMKASKNKDAAWTFIKYLISSEGSAYFASLGGTIVPARKSVANSDNFLKDSPSGTPLLYGAVSYSIPIPSPDRGAEFQATVEDTWKQIMTGNVSVDKGLSTAQTKLASLVQ